MSVHTCKYEVKYRDGAHWSPLFESVIAVKLNGGYACISLHAVMLNGIATYRHIMLSVSYKASIYSIEVELFISVTALLRLLVRVNWNCLRNHL